MEPEMHPLAGHDAAALEALGEAFAVMRNVVPPELRSGPCADLAAVYEPATRPVALATTRLATALVHRATGAPNAPGDGDLARQEREVRDETASLTAIDGERTRREPLRRQEKTEVLSEVGELLREVGLDRFEQDVLLAVSKDTGDLLLARLPTSAAAAHVWSMDRLFQRLEVFAAIDELIELERMASAWFFERVSAPGRGARAGEIDFARGVREQEWTFFDRVSVGLGTQIGDAFLDVDLPDGTVPGRVRAIAEALRDSIPGVFIVEHREGEVATFRELAEGRRFDVSEHSTDTMYGRGSGAFGRLMPLRNGDWLRSPGMLLTSPQPRQSLVKLAEGLRRHEGQWPAIAIEMAISAIGFNLTNLPRSIRPVDSVAGARLRLLRFNEALQEIGRMQEVPAEDAPAQLRARVEANYPEENLRYESFDVDEVLAEWSTALAGMARPSRQRRSGRKTGGKKKRKRR